MEGQNGFIIKDLFLLPGKVQGTHFFMKTLSYTFMRGAPKFSDFCGVSSLLARNYSRN